MFEIKEHQEDKKTETVRQKEENVPRISLHKKSLSEKCLIRPPQTPKGGLQNQKVNFIEKNKNLHKSNNGSKLNQSK